MTLNRPARSKAAAFTWGDVVRWDKGSGRITVAHSKTDAAAQGTTVAMPRTARTPTRSNARAARSRAVAGRPLHPRRVRRVGAAVLVTDSPFALITAVHHCPTVSVQGNTIDRDTDDELSMVSTTRRFEETC